MIKLYRVDDNPIPQDCVTEDKPGKKVWGLGVR